MEKFITQLDLDDPKNHKKPIAVIWPVLMGILGSIFTASALMLMKIGQNKFSRGEVKR